MTKNNNIVKKLSTIITYRKKRLVTSVFYVLFDQSIPKAPVAYIMRRAPSVELSTNGSYFLSCGSGNGVSGR